MSRSGRAALALIPLVALCAVRPAHAEQTVQVSMNGHRHEVRFPDGWQAFPEEGGVFLQPPSGRAGSVVVIIVGVPRAKDSATPLQMAKNIADSEKKEKPWLTPTTPDTMRFVGQEGAIVSLEGVPPEGGAKQGAVYVMAMTSDTTYLFKATGSLDDLNAVLDDLVAILSGFKVADGAGGGGSGGPGGFGKGGNAVDAGPTWVKEPPLPLPPEDTTSLVADPQLGVQMAKLPGWGVASGMTEYTLEKRIDETSRVVVAVWLGSETFAGSGAAYAGKVAGEAKWRWERFGGREALFVERPPQLAGAGDVVEVHVLRGGRPLVLSLRFDGGTWKSRAGKDLLGELDAAITVGDPAPVKGAVSVGGGAAVVKPGKGWTFAGYGPGAMATFDKGAGASVRVAVLSGGNQPPSLCQSDRKSPPEPKAGKVGKYRSSEYACPGDERDQVFYSVPARGVVVYIGVTDRTGKGGAGKIAAEFLKFVKLP